MQDSTKQKGADIRGRIGKTIAEKKLVLVESVGGPYSILHFSDGTKTTVSYTNKELNKRFQINTKMIRRGFYAVENEVEEVKGKGVIFQNKLIAFSRRSVWLLLFVVSFASAQNLAPVAKNDTLFSCINPVIKFDYIKIETQQNDYDPNSDRFVVSDFTTPNFGHLVADGNLGWFRYYPNLSGDSTAFQYRIKDIRRMNIGSLKSDFATVFIGKTKYEYVYSGMYLTNVTRETCRSLTSGTVNISGTTREINTVDTYGLLLPGTLIEPSDGGVFELKARR